MICIFNESSKILLEIWQEILDGECISPFEELNLEAIEYFNVTLNSEICFVFVDDEFGLCGCAVLTPLASNCKRNDNIWRPELDIGGWLLDHIKLHLLGNKTLMRSPTRIIDLKKRFYTSLREALSTILKPVPHKNIIVLHENEYQHEDFQVYAGLTYIQEYPTEGGVVGIIPGIRNLEEELKKVQSCGRVTDI